jgi:hypothetical protein
MFISFIFHQHRRGNVNLPSHPGISYPHTLEVDLLSFSLGGVKHPSAKESTLLVKDRLQDDLRWHPWDIQVEICKSLLAVLTRPSSPPTGEATRPECELWIFNWKTGQRVAVSVHGTTDSCLNTSLQYSS